MTDERRRRADEVLVENAASTAGFRGERRALGTPLTVEDLMYLEALYRSGNAVDAAFGLALVREVHALRIAEYEVRRLLEEELGTDVVEAEGLRGWPVADLLRRLLRQRGASPPAK